MCVNMFQGAKEGGVKALGFKGIASVHGECAREAAERETAALLN